MKKLSLVFMFFLLSLQLFADDDEKLKLAVMDLEDLSGKLSEETLTGASEYFRVIFAQTNRYIIISKDRQKEQISGLRKKYNTDPTYKSCTDKNCQIQLGQALSADMIVKISVSFFAGSYTLASELIDLEKEATIIAATEEYDGSPQALKAAIKNIVAKIVEAEKNENMEAAPAAPVYREQPQQQQVSSVQSRDERNCEQARKEDTISAWETYLRKYPQGVCSEEAKNFIDEELCYKAREKHNKKEWEKYLAKSPDGKCAEEAKGFLAGELAKKDMAACEKARNKSSEKGWKEYLEEFPEGQCAAEAKAAPDNIACNEAKKDGSLKAWKEYLDQYPNGKCSAQAKQNLSNQEEIEQLMKKGKNMKIAGSVLLASGVVGLVTGISIGVYQQEKAEGEMTQKALSSYSVSTALCGTMILIGIPLLTVGVLKEKEAKSYLEINNLAVVPQKGGFYATIGFDF